jgi:uncharacterized repeat protein (TIGR01451 family)
MTRARRTGRTEALDHDRRAAGAAGARLALAAALLFSLLALAPAAQAAPFVTVRVTIDKVSAIDCFEGTVPITGGCTGAADFYPVVNIDGREQTAKPIIDQNNADPDPDWVFDQTVDVTKGHAPASIEIREEDGGFRLGDEQADIDPVNGGDTANLEFDVNLAPCALTGDVTARCGKATSSAGTAPNRKARIFYTVDVIEPDLDGDDLPDSWENRGLDTDGDGTVDVDLPAMGASVARPDVFVEVDCLKAAAHSHCPNPNALRDVVQAFANGPKTNPDGSTGVQLHVDTGSLLGPATKVKGTPAGAVTGTFGDIAALAGAKSGGQGGDQITETPANTIVDWDGAKDNPATSFYDLKATNFDTRRAAAFRYALFVHQTNARAKSNDCTGGWAEGIPGNDFMVALGGNRDTDGDSTADQPCWDSAAANGVDDDGDGRVDEDGYDGIDNDGDCPAKNDANGDGLICRHGDLNVDEDHGFSVGNRSEQAGTFMHELGHTLGLGHGGDEGVNGKPNYLSVMNYAFPVCNVPSVKDKLPGGCDYSRDDLDDLVELKDATNPGLDECKGADGGRYGLGPANWNGNMTADARPLPILEGATCAAPNQTNVQADVNGDGAATTLHSYDDWASLVYAFRDKKTFLDGVADPPPTDADPRTAERARAQLSRQLAPDVSIDATGPATVTAGATIDYGLAVRNDGAGPAFDTALVGHTPAGSDATFALGLMIVGSGNSRSISYTVPCSTPDGTVLTSSATVAARDIVGVAEDSPANNRDEVRTTVQAPVLTLAKTAAAGANAGEALVYRLTYANTGGGGAKSIVVTDTLPADVYYSAALDTGAGPKPTTVTRNADGTTTLTWNVGALAGASGPQVIEYSARPSLLFEGGASVTNGARLTFTNDSGCTYSPVADSRTTSITVVAPTRDPLSHGFWKTHPETWTAELLARIQATDQRFDGLDGSAPDGRLSPAEVAATFALGGGGADILRQQLLGVYFNLATRRINAGTTISSKTTVRLGLKNVAAAARYTMATLSLAPATNAARYNDATTITNEINLNKSPVY